MMTMMAAAMIGKMNRASHSPFPSLSRCGLKASTQKSGIRDQEATKPVLAILIPNP
jgi:hypothetical protein